MIRMKCQQDNILTGKISMLFMYEMNIDFFANIFLLNFINLILNNNHSYIE